ncbi:MAG: acetate--CoA ligase [Actinomycetia bacterium]|nr:acetate--CoA ligase [Actinomycetota bacterium]MCG2790437.1 acetate--CoA ligase [Actinomycetes bacterium]
MSLRNFFCPSSVAVIGASREEEKVGHIILDNIINSGYKGKLFPVNPKADEIHGIKCYPSVLNVPGDIDLAIIVIPAQFVLQVLEECSKKNTKWSIIISAGFKETGIEGAKRERQLIEKAKDYGIRILGPNCLGIIDTECPINATFSPNMPPMGKIGFISQSGALGTAILDWAKTNKIGFSKFVSLGNKADISENDLFDDWENEKDTEVITAYLEGVKYGREFIRISSKVSKKKPIIVIKSGNTDAGARAVSSHTGTLAGSAKAYEAAFKQAGIIRANTIRDLFNYAKAFSYQPLPKGKKVAIITNAGGPGIMATDECEKSDILLASLKKETIDGLKEFLPEAANFYNPIDILGDALADRYKKTLEVVIKDNNVNAIVMLLTPQAMTQPLKTARAIVEVMENSGKSITVLTSFMGGSEVEKAVKFLAEKNIPNFDIPEEAIDTLKVMMEHTDWKSRRSFPIEDFNVDKGRVKKIFYQCQSEGRLELGEMEAREILEAYDIRMPKAELACDIDEAKEIAGRIGYPLVLKIVSPNILHKTDVGGVKIGIDNEKELEENYDEILFHVKRYMPDANIRGILVQEFIKDKKETIIGMSEDPQFGPMIMFGLGGIYIEALKDVSFRIAPLSRQVAREMVEEIKTIKLLKGIRGEDPSDIDSIIEIILRASQLVTDFPEIIEMDINPLFVKKQGEGSIAGDVRIRIGG